MTQGSLSESLRLCGVDFSGSSAMWNQGCRQSNVWVAEADHSASELRLHTLRQVQNLEGPGSPFDKLSRLLSSGRFHYAAIDAPFSLPAAYLPDGAERAWRVVADLPRDNRHFPRGAALVKTFAPELLPRGGKVMRRTEEYWLKQKANVRSTLWNGPRGGAPFTAACMTLLGRHSGPVWPFRTGDGTTLVEAFPAAQLRQWRTVHNGYNGTHADPINVRRAILAILKNEDLAAPPDLVDACLNSADALDAVLCVYAAKAVAMKALAVEPGDTSALEGHIAVHL